MSAKKDTREKKKGRSFSLSPAEIDEVDDRAAAHGFRNRGAYLLALMEADRFYEFQRVPHRPLDILRRAEDAEPSDMEYQKQVREDEYQEPLAAETTISAVEADTSKEAAGEPGVYPTQRRPRKKRNGPSTGGAKPSDNVPG